MPDQIKVYELAKRLGVSSALLMDKIRKDWKLPARPRMPALTPELAQDIGQKRFWKKAEKARGGRLRERNK